MNTSDLVSLAAVAIAALSWLDARRRINESSIAFRVENRGDLKDYYRIRNVGTRSSGPTRIDPASVAGYEMDGALFSHDMKPGSTINLSLKSSTGSLPDSIVLQYGQRHAKSRVVPFHPIDMKPSTVPEMSA